MFVLKKLKDKQINKVTGGDNINDGYICFIESIIEDFKCCCASIANDPYYLIMLDCLESGKGLIKQYSYIDAVDKLNLCTTYKMTLTVKYPELTGPLMLIVQKINDLIQSLDHIKK